MPTQQELEHSYGIEPQFFSLWLDPYMAYSCANWEETDSLEQAQQAKLDMVLDWMNLPDGGSFLDIGCGWGSLLKRGGERGYKGSGITPIAEQVAWGNHLGFGSQQSRWEDFDSTEVFDGVASIGAFEHFAPRGSNLEERLERYSAFFASCAPRLRDGGSLFLQTICVLRLDLMRDRKALREQVPALREFPGSMIPQALGEIAEAALPHFEVTKVIGRRADYGRTCRVWLQRIIDQREVCVDLVGEKKVKHFEAYLNSAATSFEKHWSTLYQVGFRKL